MPRIEPIPMDELGEDARRIIEEGVADGTYATAVPLQIFAYKSAQLLMTNFLRVAAGSEQPADLGGEHEFGTRPAIQRAAEAVLALPPAVPRRGVVVTDAGVPGRSQRGAGIGVLDHVEQIAQPGAAEAELRDFDPGAAKFTAGERVHGLSSRLACMGNDAEVPKSILYVDTCSSTALRWRMPNPRIRIAGSSAPGPMIQMNQPR